MRERALHGPTSPEHASFVGLRLAPQSVLNPLVQRHGRPPNGSEGVTAVFAEQWMSPCGSG